MVQASFSERLIIVFWHVNNSWFSCGFLNWELFVLPTGLLNLIGKHS
uniref:Uncharacterized protein n=1 Tax=Rhizophora mucronata TaxID=61149 RepID=A0A2P2QJ54_RHIMU